MLCRQANLADASISVYILGCGSFGVVGGLDIYDHNWSGLTQEVQIYLLLS